MGLDSSRLRLRVQVIGVGIWVQYLVAIAMAVWAAATWNRPYREQIAGTVVTAVVAAFLISRLPAEKIVRGPLREAFFLAWSLGDIALVRLLAYWDGGVTSPATLTLFLTLVFAALSYPLRSMITVAVATVAGVGHDGEALHRHADADLYAAKAHLRS
jgi:multisubunit Na+/H+ antiporter MnhE subunit